MATLASARKFVTTVALQLTAAVPAILALQDQWERLVLQPLARVRRWMPQLLHKPLVVVVDALDKCVIAGDATAVLGLSSLDAMGNESWLRVLLTSQPETYICFGIHANSSAGVDRFARHEVESPLVDHDIAIYFYHLFGHLGMTIFCNSDWPGPDLVDLLVKQAGGLFM